MKRKINQINQEIYLVFMWKEQGLFIATSEGDDRRDRAPSAREMKLSRNFSHFIMYDGITQDLTFSNSKVIASRKVEQVT